MINRHNRSLQVILTISKDTLDVNKLKRFIYSRAVMILNSYEERTKNAAKS